PVSPGRGGDENGRFVQHRFRYSPGVRPVVLEKISYWMPSEAFKSRAFMQSTVDFPTRFMNAAACTVHREGNSHFSGRPVRVPAYPVADIGSPEAVRRGTTHILRRAGQRFNPPFSRPNMVNQGQRRREGGTRLANRRRQMGEAEDAAPPSGHRRPRAGHAKIFGPESAPHAGTVRPGGHQAASGHRWI